MGSSNRKGIHYLYSNILFKQDFGGGGAYPECHIVQYPLGMGRKDVSKVGHQHALALQTDKDGNIQYDMVLRKGSKVVHSSLAETRERGLSILL